MAITLLPTPPSRSDSPALFAERGDAFLGALPTLAQEINATVASFGTATKWVSGTTYAEGASVWSPVDYQAYRRKTAGAGTTDPSADATNWALIYAGAIQAINTIAGLRLVAVTTTRDIALRGYASSGDGGGGLFYGVTGAAAGTYVDNGGTVIVPTGGDGSAAWLRNYSGAINVRWFGALATADDTAEIQSAVNAAGSGGEVFFPPGVYRLTSPLLVENFRGIKLTGSSGQYGLNGSRILGAHTGKAVLSLVGTMFASIEDLIIEGDATTKPKTGLLLGRSSAASAGSHGFVNLQVQGHFSVAAIYNVASESNVFTNLSVGANTSPIAALYMSQSDTQAIGGLTPSSMEHNIFVGGHVGNYDATSTSTSIFIDCGGSTGHIHFYGTFVAKEGGQSFIKIRLGVIDALDTEFPIGLHDVLGEASTAPAHGLHFTANAIRVLSGFAATNLRFQTPATNHIYVDPNTVTLAGARITTPWRATNTKPSTFARVDGSYLSLLAESAVTVADLRGTELIHNTGGASIASQTGGVVRTMGGTAYALNNTLAISSGSVVSIGGTTVLGARRTGYTNAMTGTADRATLYDTSSITLVQLAQRVKALQDDLIQHGIIGST